MSRWNPFYEEKTEPMPFEAATQRIAQLPAPALAVSAFAVGAVSMWGTAVVYRRFFRRIRNVDWITADMYRNKRWIKGKVVSVGDADNFRVYHTPGFGWRWPLKFRTVPTTQKALKNNTIHIRMAAVDAPEGAHFGRPMQAHYEQSLGWLKNKIMGRTVYCQLLRRDQYSRVVAMPYLKPWVLPGFLAKGKCIPVEMLRAGWVVMYDQGGAEYGPFSKEELLAMEAQARNARLGIWQDGPLKETPAEYKRRYASEPIVEDEPPAKFTPNSRAKRTSKTSGLRKLFSKLFSR